MAKVPHINIPSKKKPAAAAKVEASKPAAVPVVMGSNTESEHKFTLLDKLYGFDWLVRAAVSMESADVSIERISHDLDDPERCGNNVIDNDVLRYTWQSNKLYILSGINQVRKAKDAGATTINGKNVTDGVLTRIFIGPAPGKHLSEAELLERINSNAAADPTNRYQAKAKLLRPKVVTVANKNAEQHVSKKDMAPKPKEKRKFQNDNLEQPVDPKFGRMFSKRQAA
jgi:hypothetical protein